MPRPIKDKWFALRLKAHEKEYLRRESDERGQTMAEYARNVLFANAILPRSSGKKVLTRP